jgi:hypothetical protein
MASLHEDRGEYLRLSGLVLVNLLTRYSELKVSDLVLTAPFLIWR